MNKPSVSAGVVAGVALGAAALGAAEDDGAAATLRLEDTGDDLDLVHGVNAVDDLLDRVDGLVLVVGVLRADVGRLDHEAAGESDDGSQTPVPLPYRTEALHLDRYLSQP